MIQFYAGIGSRETPSSVLSKMQAWGSWFASHGWILRSGHARGADQAFEFGCVSTVGQKEIFTPEMGDTRPDWYDHAATFHPAWIKCAPWARALHARNSAIVLGAALNDPVKFVLCWTKDGKTSGGTGQALRIAAHHQIPIFNFHDEQAEQRLREWLA